GCIYPYMSWRIIPLCAPARTPCLLFDPTNRKGRIVLTPEHRAMQRDIIAELFVSNDFDARQDVERRVGFLADYLVATGSRALVLGISGGVDSLVGGCLAQRAAEQARQRGHTASFVAMRLPYGEQRDEPDAQASLEVIKPDQVLTVNIKPASDAMLTALLSAE